MARRRQTEQHKWKIQLREQRGMATAAIRRSTIWRRSIKLVICGNTHMDFITEVYLIYNFMLIIAIE